MCIPSVERLGQQIAENIDVLCLDEVSITNLQNVVVFGPLIRHLCERGVVLVTTANKAPHELYEGGQDRDLHLSSLVRAISDHCSVYKYDSHLDYRKQLPLPHQANRVFQWRCPENGPESARFLESWWLTVAGRGMANVTVPVGYGRKLPVLQSSCATCARFSFKDLCTFPPVALGAADYSELCNRFRTVIVADIPKLRPEGRDAARRWTLFIDNCYESHVRLIITTAAVGPEDLLDLSDFANEDTNDGQLLQEASFAVQRTTSRLHEMQSANYLNAFSSSESTCEIGPEEQRKECSPRTMAY
jgi:predicted ATPase